MTTNILLASSAIDLAKALYEETPHGNQPWRNAVVGRLAQELRSNSHHAVPMSELPTFAPIWASEGLTSHILPAAHIREDLWTLTDALAKAAATPKAMADQDSTLGRRCSGMAAALDREIWPSLIDRARDLRVAVKEWSKAERRARRIARCLRRPASVPSLGRRTWTRVESIAQLLDRGRGTAWCVVKGGDLARDYMKRFSAGDLTFWTLSAHDGQTLALLSHGSDGEVEEFRSFDNSVARAFRADILRLVRAKQVNLDWPSQDIESLALDPDLGHRGQPFHYGLLSSRGGVPGFHYRLWSDGRRRRYLLSISEATRVKAPTHFLRLDASPKRDVFTPLTGATPPAWDASASRLFTSALTSAFPKAYRPRHADRAIRIARAG